jgi:hypothetical protein
MAKKKIQFLLSSGSRSGMGVCGGKKFAEVGFRCVSQSISTSLSSLIIVVAASRSAIFKGENEQQRQEGTATKSIRLNKLVAKIN